MLQMELRPWNYSLPDSVPVGITAQRENRTRQGSAAIASNLLDPDRRRKAECRADERDICLLVCRLTGTGDGGIHCGFSHHWRGEQESIQAD